MVAATWVSISNDYWIAGKINSNPAWPTDIYRPYCILQTETHITSLHSIDLL